VNMIGLPPEVKQAMKEMRENLAAIRTLLEQLLEQGEHEDEPDSATG